MSAEPVYIGFDALSSLVGRELGPTNWRTVTQADIDAFARATGDYYWIHVDVERARRERGGTIAHGLLTLSLISAFGAELLQVDGIGGMLNYGLDRVRFTAPAPVGASLRARQKIDGVDALEGRARLRTTFTIEMQDAAAPVCIASSIIMVYRA